MDGLMALLQDPAATGSIYVTAILVAMQLAKTDLVPAAWWTAHEGLLRLLPLVLGVAAHWLLDAGLATGEIVKAGLTDGVYALGIFNGSKIIRG